jgi:hypothetical protein
MAEKLGTLTDRDRYWLGHQAACEKSGLSAKAYARRHRLSVHALYQARKRLRGLGALEVGSVLPAGMPSPPEGVARRGARGGLGRGAVPSSDQWSGAVGCGSGSSRRSRACA